jgi:hypothetical protein
MPAVDVIVSYPGKVYAYHYDHLNEASPYYKLKKEISSLGRYHARM